MFWGYKDNGSKVKIRGRLTGQVDNAGDDDDRPPDQRHHGQHLGHATQTHGAVQVALLQAVLGLGGKEPKPPRQSCLTLTTLG